MTQANPPKTHRKLPAVGLLLQLFAIILLPLTVLLVVITFGSLSLHERAMRNMVGERDGLAVKAAASALNSQVDTRVKELSGAVELFQANPAAPLTDLVKNSTFLLPDFDTWVAVFDQNSELLGVRYENRDWKTWITDQLGKEAYAQLASQPGKLVVVQDPITGELVGLLAKALDGKGTIVGAFSIQQMAETTLEASLPSNGQLSVMLVGGDQQILYHVGDLSDQSVDHPGVAEALQGQSGTLYLKVGGDEHVTAYSPVADAGWALVTEESWEAVSTPTLQSTQIAPLVMVPVLFILLLAVWFGASQVVRPLRRLEARTATLAGGDYQTIRKPVGGISEIQQLQKELVEMADKVNEAQRSLHGYIGAITEAQEDERRRLARELHDDTLQALIALKQRVQLAQLAQEPTGPASPPEAAELDEIASMTEKTIDNLRRLTRAMRPAYLEDLGLVPALEMLAREAGESAGIPIEFHRQGTERRLPASNELAFYRIAQEALSNIVRHAQASKGSLTISFSTDAVQLLVSDDGLGFVVPAAPSAYAGSGHYGLLGLHERAELIGAALEIVSLPGKGTRITVSLPVLPDPAE